MKKSAHTPLTAYFSAEFGISNDLPIYAGGLGILAGDTIKGASDIDLPMVGIGLLFEAQFFKQTIDSTGWQIDEQEEVNRDSAGLEQVMDNGKPLSLVTNLAGTDVWVQAYRKVLSPLVSIYFLTTDCSYNSPEWKNIMVEEYCCDDEMQLKQMLVLGVAGAKLLQVLGIKPDIYHINEGRPIFLFWQLVHQIMCALHIPYEEAFEKAKKQIVYTNHTLMRAGNLVFAKEIIKKYAASFVSELGVESDILVEPGIESEDGAFSITKFALTIASKASAVSKLHEELSIKEWPEYQWHGITNGIHLPTWQKKDISVAQTPEELWQAHSINKENLARVVQNRTGFSYDPERLVISWARRITGYKQLLQLFADTPRLSRILSSDRPIQLLIAGKAHYGDDDAKRTIQEVISHMQKELAGHAIYVPNYNIELAQAMVSGSDVWLNTPEMGKEACGTSGMKAAVNGVLNCTVADGWAAEIDWNGIGWVLDSTRVSDSLYEQLENAVAPLFYDRNSNYLPEGWIEMMQKSIAIQDFVSTKRMLNEYRSELYSQDE